MADAGKHLILAKKQLEKVQVAWYEPTDWSDLSLYGFLALENAVAAAATHLGVGWKPTHPSKYEAAVRLHERYGLPDVATLLRQLNELRKSEGYGDVESPEDVDPEDIARAVEDYIDRIEQLMGGGPDE